MSEPVQWTGEDGNDRRITSVRLGWQDHGILTGELEVDYGGIDDGHRVGGFRLDAGRDAASVACGVWVQGVLRATGVSEWGQVAGRNIVVVFEGTPKFGPGWAWPKVLGIEPLPFEPGKPFMFSALYEEVHG